MSEAGCRRAGKNGVMSNLTCLPDTHREVADNPTSQAVDRKQAVEGLGADPLHSGNGTSC